MADDQFGIQKLFPTRTGGREWYLKEDIAAIMADPQSAGDLEDDVASGDSTNGFLVGDNGQVRLQAAAASGMRETGDTKLNHSAAKSRGYMFSPDEWDIAGIEATMRMFCTDHENDESRVLIKGPTGSHHSNTVDCSGSSYIIRWYLADTGPLAGMVQTEKEQWHVEYAQKPDSPIPTGVGHIFNKWVILKYVIYKELFDDPDNVGQKITGIHIKGFININNDGHTFVECINVVDTGGYGDKAEECNADRPDEIMTWKAPRMMFRWDGPIIKWKDLSVREVDVTGLGSGEPEQPPTTGTISRDFTFKYNLGNFAVDSCGVGQSTPLTTFYDVADNGSASNLHRDRYRAGVLANGSGSQVIGHTPRQVIVQLSKTGNPPSGNITVVLRRASDDSVAVTYTWTGGTLNATALGTSKASYTFENLTSNYVWQNGDIINVEYSGNTVDTSNEVNVFRNTTNPYDGTLTCAKKFDSGGPPPTGYSAPDSSRDYAWTIKE